MTHTDHPPDPERRCSFCGRRGKAVRKLFRSHGKRDVAICDRCIDRCKQLLAEQDPGSGDA